MKKDFSYINEESERINPDNYRLGIFYFNKKDSRVIIPKWQKSRGWTVNFAKPGAYLFILAILAIVLLFMFFA